MMRNIGLLLLLCFLMVNAQNDSSTTTPSTLEGKDRVKIEPTNISALYIGDLLRTKPKDVLETSGSVHQPIILSQGYHSPDRVVPAPVAGRTYNYKAHGGHEYVETEYVHPSRLSPESRSKIPIPAKRVGTAARVVPANVLGHLLTVKPVRVIPISRNPATPSKEAHYPNDDCSKSGEHSYSSEEKPYAPEQPTYRRAKQIAPGPQIEYRSPQRSYPEDDRSDDYSSHSDPSTGSYNSKSYPSDTDTKSHSSGSYTKSKSTSTSRTVTPSRSKQKTHVVPTAVMDPKDFENTGPAHGNQDIVVYKVRERPDKGPSTYSENSEKQYPPSNYEGEHKPRDSPYTQHPSEVRKPRKHPHRERPHHSNSEQQPQKDIPQQYGPLSYEQDPGTYDQSSYTGTNEQRYRDQNKQSNSYPHQEHEYTSRPDSRGREHPKSSQYQSYQNPESGHHYEPEQPNEPQSRKRQRNPHYDRPSNDGREDAGYRARAREPQTQGYNYPPEQQLQSSRSRKERPQSSYEAYVPHEPHTESVPQSQGYERNHPALRPSEEKQLNQYAYEATPHQETPKPSRGTHKRQYRESSRSARSPERHMKPAIVESRSHLPGVENQPVIMVSKESKPYISRSVSYSKSSYNMGDTEKPEPKANYKEAYDQHQPGDNPTAEGRQNIDSYDANHQTAYKPYNSEYPASYANDNNHHHSAERQYQSQNYNQPQSYEQPHSYEQTPSQYPQYGNQQSYDNSAQSDGSYEQSDGPGKKDKNHHYISNISGYKEEYGSSEPLNIDDAFFEKYGISKKAKVIVATAMKPNLFVADGTKAGEGGYAGASGPINEEPYEPNFKQNYKEDSYSDSPEELGAPRQIPGSFDELVNTNPTFLRKLPHIIDPADAVFNMDASFDDAEFRNVEQKGFIVSQGPREIVQQHGDGVSRIVFNVPTDESKAEASKVQEYREEKRHQDERISAAASTALGNAIKSE